MVTTRLWTEKRFLAVGLPAVFLGLLSCTAMETTPVRSPAGTTTTIVIVRHAERDEGLDPPLNEEGQARAQALADALDENGVTAIYTVDLIRNRQSVVPLAERLNLSPRFYSELEAADTRALANNFVAEVIAQHAGGVVLWVGNTGPVVGEQSGNLQELYTRLGGTGREPIRYEDMYVAIIPEEGSVRFIKANYGGPSSLD